MKSGDRVLKNLTFEVGTVVSITDENTILVEVDDLGEQNWAIGDCKLIEDYDGLGETEIMDLGDK